MKHKDTSRKRIYSLNSGFSLMEGVVAAAVSLIVIVGILQLLIHCSVLAEQSGNMTFATSEAQDKLEEIRDHSYRNIVVDYTSGCVCADGVDNDLDGETDHPDDTQCSSQGDTDESDEATSATGLCAGTFNLSQVTGQGAIYINTSNPDLLEVEVVISWQDKYGRIIGEDTDLDGTLDTGEDQDSNNRLSSPVTLTTLIAER